MLPKPVPGQLACALDYRCNLAQADVLSKPRPQTSLDAPIARVALYQQGQDRALHRASRSCSLGRGGKSGFQGRQPLGFPAVQGLARNADLLTQSTDGPIAATVGHQRADPLCVVVGCARMCLDHWFLPGGDGDVLYQPYLPGSFLATAASHTVTSFSLFLNLALTTPIATDDGEKAAEILIDYGKQTGKLKQVPHFVLYLELIRDARRHGIPRAWPEYMRAVIAKSLD